MQHSDPDSGTILLPDGTAIYVRPIRAADREALQRFHGLHSDLSVYRRFFHAQPALGESQARYFTNIDGVHRFALIALDPNAPDEIIGVARFDREPETDRAEYAAIIAGAYQGRGLGLILTQRLVVAARARGVTTFRAFVQPENIPMIKLLRRLELPETVCFEDGVERIDIDLGGGAGPNQEVQSSPALQMPSPRP